MKFIDPRIDFAFKRIFGSEDSQDILISFLESLMGLEKNKRIKEITILDPYLVPKIRDMKTTILDVRCTDYRGITYIVEMQVKKVDEFAKRIQYNASKTYVNQIGAGEDYPNLNQVIAVTITDFRLFKEFEHPVSCHLTQETETGLHLLTEVVYYFIELPKFGKTADELETTLDRWIFFLKEARKLEDIPKGFEEPPLVHAFEKAMAANMSREEAELYDKAGIAIADTKGAISLAKREGREEGLKEGLKEGRRETAKNLLKLGTLSIEQIAQAAELSPEEVQEMTSGLS